MFMKTFIFTQKMSLFPDWLLNKCLKFSFLDFKIFTARKWSLGQGNIFTSVCQEFCPWGKVSACQNLVQGGVCLWSGGVWETAPPQGRTSQWADAPPSTTGYDQQAGSMHPPGMHSFFFKTSYSTARGNSCMQYDYPPPLPPKQCGTDYRILLCSQKYTPCGIVEPGTKNITSTLFSEPNEGSSHQIRVRLITSRDTCKF